MYGVSVVGTGWGGGRESVEDDGESGREEEGVDAEIAVEGFAADEKLAESFDGGVASDNNIRWRAAVFYAIWLCGVLACDDWSEDFENGEVVDRTGWMV